MIQYDEAKKSKLKYLLLNKIENLPWYYFNIDLNAALQDTKVYCGLDEVNSFFDKIEVDQFGNFSFVGEISTTEVVTVLFTLIDNNPRVLPEVVKSLFKNNDIQNESDADEGMMGKLNRKNREARNKLFTEKMRDGFRGVKGNIVVLAEGDSWFQFPKIYLKDPVKDIIDWMIEDPIFAVKSLAAGGDWLSNIFYAGEYIEELPKLTPDVFLISGGGNDLVGNNRLALMVRNISTDGLNNLQVIGLFKSLIEKRREDDDIDLVQYKRGLKFVSQDFFKFLNLYFVQYFVFLHNITTHDKYQNMLILTQGYDFAIPFNKSRANWVTFRRLVNEITDTGGWLFEPLSIKGITDPKDQKAVIYTLIYEFNEMLIQLAEFHKHPNVFHIDCRGLATEDDWFDELHLKSDTFEKIANVFKLCINQNIKIDPPPTSKVYKVRDLV